MKNKYIFILTITIVASLLLSVASESLKTHTLKNIEIDKKKNIISSVGVDISDFNNFDIDNYFIKNIDTLIINTAGKINTSLLIADLKEVENNQTGEVKYFNNEIEYLPMYKDNDKNAIIIPISGKGLWSTLFGYFAIDTNNYSTVKGITFYKHKETPGLGGEVSKKWFQNNFIGKEIFNDSRLVSIVVAKAGYADKDNLYQVDGISGATITSKGVSSFIERDLQRYEKYFSNNKK